MDSMSAPTPSQPIVTSDDYSSIPSIISWFFGITIILCVVAKIATNLSLKRSLVIGDTSILLALVFSVGMIATVSLEAVNGLGKHQLSLTTIQLERYQKGAYATDIFYILTLTFSKGSVLVLLHALTPYQIHLELVYILGGLLFVWSISSLFVSAFQCPLPQVWAILNNRCLDKHIFWTYFGAFNILFEMLLVFLPAFMMSGLQVSLSKKFFITGLFALRIFVIGAIIAELVFRNRIRGSSDQTFSMWPVIVCIQLVQSFSIIFACIPYLKPFFASLESGMIRSDDTRRREGRTSLFSYRLPSKGRDSSRRHQKIKMFELNAWTKVGRDNGATSEDQWGREPGDMEGQGSTSHIILAATTVGVDSDHEDIQ